MIIIIDRAVKDLLRPNVVVEVVKEIVDALGKAISRERGPKGPPKKGARKRERIMITAQGRTKRQARISKDDWEREKA